MRTPRAFTAAALGLSLCAAASAQQIDAQEKTAAASAAAAAGREAKAWVEAHMAELVEQYVWFHSHPELSLAEEQTADRLADALEAAGFEVARGVGGHGVVALLANGEGPTLMLRTDLDALPVTEQTPLPFASKATAIRPDGSSTGVMHACGHDVHMTNILAVSRFLAEHQDLWAGTLMVIGQPAEELGRGASAMLSEGLFTRFPKPDYAVAMHVGGDVASGVVRVLAGPAFANVDSVDIVVKGRGGHGSAPHTTVDPVAQAAELIVSLQAVVGREVKPSEPAVVTVGAIHGGTKHNIIGDECRLQLTVRTYKPEVRRQVLEAIKRRAAGVAAAWGAPEPEVSFSEGTPSLRNSDELAGRLKGVFEQTIGQENVQADQPTMGGEDFGQYGIAGVPILMYRVGSVSPERLERFQRQGIPPPSLHSSQYYPDFETTLKTAAATMTAAAVELLPAKN